MTPESILEELLARYTCLLPLRAALLNAFQQMVACFQDGGAVLCCGNGGSAADSEHIVGELMKSFRLPRPLTGDLAMRFSVSESSRMLAERLQMPLPAISLTSQGALLSAYANDVDADMVYAQQVLGYSLHQRNLLIAMSTSGNSANVVNAVRVASLLGMPALAITGRGGGKLAQYSDVCLCLPEKDTYRVQELTLPVYHALCAMTEAYFFKPASNCGK